MNLSSKNKIHVETGMSALSDIIFMLLIFFVIASTLAVNGEQVSLPKTSTGEQTQASTTVTIDAGNNYFVNHVPTTRDQVESLLQTEMQNSKDKKVIMNIDYSVQTGETIELLSVLKRNNWQPFIATKPLEKK
jgi:biopolymer transport protein ExbD